MAVSNQGVIVQAIELIESRIGIAVGKQYQRDFPDLFNRLAQGNPKKYLQTLRHSSEKSPEWQRLINTFTIGETYFLREINHFDLLKKHILPKLVLHRRQQRDYRLRIWSAGCASGEEPYSIAMILHQFLPDLARWHVEIHGTDINTYALQSATHGVYRQWAFRHTDNFVQQNYFNKVENGYQIKPVIKNMVTFRQQNLLQENTLGVFDIIFCKNVLLYFEDHHIKQVEHHLFHALHPEGWLFLGQAEALRFHREGWQTHIFPGSPIYQRPTHNTLAIDIDHRHPASNESSTETITTDTDQDYYGLAVEAVHADNFSHAEHYLSLALTQTQQRAYSHTLLAWLFANRRAFPEAQAHIAATLALDPLHSNAHYVAALIASEQDQLEQAITALHMTLYCENYHLLAMFMLGNLYAQMGQLSKAYKQWKKVQQAIEPLSSESYVSDLSDLTVGQLDALITTHLKDT